MKAGDDLKPYVFRKSRNRSAVSRTACKSGGVSWGVGVVGEFVVEGEGDTACKAGTDERKVMRAQ